MDVLDKNQVIPYLRKIGFTEKEIKCYNDLMTGMDFYDMRIWYGDKMSIKCIDTYKELAEK